MKPQVTAIRRPVLRTKTRTGTSEPSAASEVSTGSGALRPARGTGNRASDRRQRPPHFSFSGTPVRAARRDRLPTASSRMRQPCRRRICAAANRARRQASSISSQSRCPQPRASREVLRRRTQRGHDRSRRRPARRRPSSAPRAGSARSSTPGGEDGKAVRSQRRRSREDDRQDRAPRAAVGSRSTEGCPHHANRTQCGRSVRNLRPWIASLRSCRSTRIPNRQPPNRMDCHVASGGVSDLPLLLRARLRGLRLCPGSLAALAARPLAS